MLWPSAHSYSNIFYFIDLYDWFQTRSEPIAYGGHAEGVILRSSDGGQNWAIVYQNKDVKSINAIAVINGTVWAVGENGLVIRIELGTESKG